MVEATAEVGNILIDLTDLDGIRIRMEHQDAVREEAIKLSRDVQKLSKQAIYSVQRGSLAEAAGKLSACEGLIVKILAAIEQVIYTH